jgi:hypothetical protein
MKAKEIDLVYSLIDKCKSIDDMRNISLVVDELEKSQPAEKEIIQDMRDLISDLTFKFYFERYPQYLTNENGEKNC